MFQNGMSEKLKIKLSIANRVYPLTIDANQEEGLRKAAKNIEVMIKQFEQSYSVRDKQDVLAMCALQFASQVEQKSIDKANVNEHVEEKLNALNVLLQKHLVS
jgi:cell division protein ZapA